MDDDHYLLLPEPPLSLLAVDKAVRFTSSSLKASLQEVSRYPVVRDESVSNPIVDTSNNLSKEKKFKYKSPCIVCTANCKLNCLTRPLPPTSSSPISSGVKILPQVEGSSPADLS